MVCDAADALARPEPVNKPELLPPGEKTTVIDVAGFLTAGEVRHRILDIHMPSHLQYAHLLAAEILLDSCFLQVLLASSALVFLPQRSHSVQITRIKEQIKGIEDDTGFRFRLLAQNYPQTPGLAIRDYWAIDDMTIVCVVDPGFGDILNFNVGQSVDLEVCVIASSPSQCLLT